MNDVESYLKKSGKWRMPITTDRGHAIQGDGWWPTYYADWINANDREKLSPGGWTRDDNGHDWWITTTPEWDRQWFQKRGVKPPKRFGDKSSTYWKDCGGGLSKLSYAGQPRLSRPGRMLQRAWRHLFRGNQEAA